MRLYHIKRINVVRVNIPFLKKKNLLLVLTSKDRLRDLESLSDDEALFAELENEEDNDVSSSIRERRIKEIQDE